MWCLLIAVPDQGKYIGDGGGSGTCQFSMGKIDGVNVKVCQVINAGNRSYSDSRRHLRTVRTCDFNTPVDATVGIPEPILIAADDMEGRMNVAVRGDDDSPVNST